MYIHNSSYDFEHERRLVQSKIDSCKADLTILEHELLDIESRERAERLRENHKRIEYLQENKDVILNFVHHTCGSCSDENPCNGIGKGGKYELYRCERCALLDILDTDSCNGQYDVTFSVHISEI